jgi:septal ring factor EnvC (AmiA/AmiB activator)
MKKEVKKNNSLRGGTGMDIRSLFEKMACKARNLLATCMQKNVMIGLFATTAALGFCAHMYLKDTGASDFGNLPAEFQGTFKALEARLTQTESRLGDINKLEEHVKMTEAKIMEAEEKLKMAEDQLSTAGHKLQYTENKIKDIEAKVDNPDGLNAGQNSELARVDDEIRKEVKRQIKSIEQGE